MPNNEEICVHLSNLNEAPSESYEEKKFCFLTISDVEEVVAGSAAKLQVSQPGSGQLNIWADQDIQTLSIFDAAGRRLYHSQPRFTNTQSLFFIQPSGFYVCLVQLRDGRQLSQRFVYR